MGTFSRTFTFTSNVLRDIRTLWVETESRPKTEQLVHKKMGQKRVWGKKCHNGSVNRLGGVRWGEVTWSGIETRRLPEIVQPFRRGGQSSSIKYTSWMNFINLDVLLNWKLNPEFQWQCQITTTLHEFHWQFWIIFLDAIAKAKKLICESIAQNLKPVSLTKSF